jgi:hypothetical protein
VNCGCFKVDDFRAYRVLVLKWTFHGTRDKVILAVFAVRKGEIAARLVPVKEKLPHLTDELANEVDDIVSKLVEKAESERWSLDDFDQAELALHHSFKIDRAYHIEVCRHEGVEDAAEKAAQSYLARASWVDSLTEDIWHAFES